MVQLVWQGVSTRAPNNSGDEGHPVTWLVQHISPSGKFAVSNHVMMLLKSRYDVIDMQS